MGDKNELEATISTDALPLPVPVTRDMASSSRQSTERHVRARPAQTQSQKMQIRARIDKLYGRAEQIVHASQNRHNYMRSTVQGQRRRFGPVIADEGQNQTPE